MIKAMQDKITVRAEEISVELVRALACWSIGLVADQGWKWELAA